MINGIRVRGLQPNSSDGVLRGQDVHVFVVNENGEERQLKMTSITITVDNRGSPVLLTGTMLVDEFVLEGLRADVAAMDPTP